VKAAIIAISRDGIALAAKLAGLFDAADIYVPPRLAEAAAEAGEAGKAEADSRSGRNPEPDQAQPGIIPGTADAAGKTGFTGNSSRDACKETAASGCTENRDVQAGRGENREEDLVCGGQEVVLKTLNGGFYPGVAEIFSAYPALVFVSAAAVAVRAIAPCLAGKDCDPAVVSVDEGGQFAISLLSGHLGGANALAEMVAHHLGAQAVITTATDTKGISAFDSLARQWGWAIENLPDLKHISAAMLEGREIVLYGRQAAGSAAPQGGVATESLKDLLAGKLARNIYITEKKKELSRARHGAVIIDSRLEKWPVPEGVPQVILRPKTVAAGVGCKKGVPAQAIIEAIEQAFREAGFALKSLSCLASGEFKAGEAGLIKAARYFGVPLKIFSRADIAAALEENALKDCSRSAFVKEQVGVGAVAEPCAALGSGGKGAALPTRRGEGITVSLAEGPLFLSLNYPV